MSATNRRANPFRLPLALPYRSYCDHPFQPFFKKSICVLPLSLDSALEISGGRILTSNLLLLAIHVRLCASLQIPPTEPQSSLEFLDPPFDRARPLPIASPLRSRLPKSAAHSCLPRFLSSCDFPPIFELLMGIDFCFFFEEVAACSVRVFRQPAGDAGLALRWVGGWVGGWWGWGAAGPPRVAGAGRARAAASGAVERTPAVWSQGTPQRSSVTPQKRLEREGLAHFEATRWSYNAGSCAGT